MSSIGSLGSILPAGLSGASRSAGNDSNRIQADLALQGTAALRSRQATREVGESDGEVADRDADGRLPWQAPDRNSEEEPAPTAGPPADDSGRLLDFTV